MNIRDRQSIRDNTDMYLGTVQVKYQDLLELLDELDEAVRVIKSGHPKNVNAFLAKYDACDETAEEMKEDHPCEDCGTLDNVKFGPCPYNSELYGGDAFVYLCSDCNEERCKDI